MISKLAEKRIPMTASHHGARSQKISAIVVHYTASIVKDSAEVVKYWERNDPYSSANYIIDVNGIIAAVIPEEQRPYTTGSYGLGNRDIDDRAITIECSCDSDKMTVGLKTIESLISLMADISERYSMSLIWTGDEEGTVHVHRWYQSTPCPGDYLYRKLPIITLLADQKVRKSITDDLDERVDNLETMVGNHTYPIYNGIDDIPGWAYKEISWLIEHGYLRGDDLGLQLSHDMLRTLVIMTRMVMEVWK